MEFHMFNRNAIDQFETVEILEVGEAVMLTNGGSGPDDEEGINIVWGNPVTEEPEEDTL